MTQLGKITDMLNNLADELAVHGTDIYELCKMTKSLDDKLESMVSSTYMYYTCVQL